MTVEQDRRDHVLKGEARGWRALVPGWYVRWRLRSVVAEIARIERELAQEFGVVEIAPLLRDLEDLGARRDELLRRLQD